jgi:glycosyltransferase involved in cell wall biosynthesis
MTRLRVAFLAGTLREGGAEKQLVYAATSLSRDVDVEVLCLTQGEQREQVLRNAGVPTHWVGKLSSPAFRLGTIARRLRVFRPDLVQAGHFYTNLYVALGAKVAGAVSVGAIRSDGRHEIRANGRWGPWLLRFPSWILANSENAKHNLVAAGYDASRVYVAPNVVDLSAPRRRDQAETAPVAITVSSLRPGKRVHLFLEALALVRQTARDLTGIVVGEGPEREELTRRAESLGLGPHVAFLGHRSDVPELLAKADIFVFASAFEGYPNVLLEAMAAGLPVVTTAAGDAPRIVEEGRSGFVTSDDARQIAERLCALAESSELRKCLGGEGRRLAEQRHALPLLRDRLLGIYDEILMRSGRTPRRSLPGMMIPAENRGGEFAERHGR